MISLYFVQSFGHEIGRVEDIWKVETGLEEEEEEEEV